MYHAEIDDIEIDHLKTEDFIKNALQSETAKKQIEEKGYCTLMVAEKISNETIQLDIYKVRTYEEFMEFYKQNLWNESYEMTKGFSLTVKIREEPYYEVIEEIDKVKKQMEEELEDATIDYEFAKLKLQEEIEEIEKEKKEILDKWNEITEYLDHLEEHIRNLTIARIAICNELTRITNFTLIPFFPEFFWKRHYLVITPYSVQRDKYKMIDRTTGEVYLINKEVIKKLKQKAKEEKVAEYLYPILNKFSKPEIDELLREVWKIKEKNGFPSNEERGFLYAYSIDLEELKEKRFNKELMKKVANDIVGSRLAEEGFRVKPMNIIMRFLTKAHNILPLTPVYTNFSYEPDIVLEREVRYMLSRYYKSWKAKKLRKELLEIHRELLPEAVEEFYKAIDIAIEIAKELKPYDERIKEKREKSKFAFEAEMLKRKTTKEIENKLNNFLLFRLLDILKEFNLPKFNDIHTEFYQYYAIPIIEELDKEGREKLREHGLVLRIKAEEDILRYGIRFRASERKPRSEKAKKEKLKRDYIEFKQKKKEEFKKKRNEMSM